MLKSFQADQLLSSFAEQLLSFPQDFLEGIYLTGSITLNDFQPDKSDIDFVVLCKEWPDENTLTRLKAMHAAFTRKFPKPDLSGQYIVAGALQAERIEHSQVLSYHQGKLRFTSFEMAPVTLWELKHNAITLYGEDPKKLHMDIALADVENFLYHNINSYWVNWVRRYSFFLPRKILLLIFPRFTEWVILGVGRQLYTLQTGRIVSKLDAGYFCLEYLPSRYHPILQQAIDIRKDNRYIPLLRSHTIRLSALRARQTIECATYMISLFNEAYSTKTRDSAIKHL